MSKILGLILIHISGTGIMSFSCGSFVLYIEDALHFKRSAFFLINSLTVLFAGLSVPLFKKASQKLSPSLLCSLCAFFESINYLGFSYFKSYRVFVILGILNGIFINGISSPAVIEVLNSSFPKNSGRLLSVILSVSTLFSSLFINLLHIINKNFSYTWGYRLIAFTGLAFALAGSFLIRKVKINASPFVRRKASLKDKKLLICGFILFFGNLANLALFNNLIPFLKELSFPSGKAQLLSSLVIFLVAFSRLFWGKLFTSLDPFSVLFFLTLSPFAASLLFIFSAEINPLIYPSLIFLAFNASFNALPAQSLSKKLKKEGTDTFLLFSSILGSSAGSCAAASFYDISSSYFPFWKILALISFLVSVLSFYLLRHYSHDGPVVSG